MHACKIMKSDISNDEFCIQNDGFWSRFERSLIHEWGLFTQVRVWLYIQVYFQNGRFFATFSPKTGAF